MKIKKTKIQVMKKKLMSLVLVITLESLLYWLIKLVLQQ